jgi:hypothetical protein
VGGALMMASVPKLARCPNPAPRKYVVANVEFWAPCKKSILGPLGRFPRFPYTPRYFTKSQLPRMIVGKIIPPDEQKRRLLFFLLF